MCFFHDPEKDNFIYIEINLKKVNGILLNNFSPILFIIREIISFKVNPDITFEQLRIHSKILFTVNALNIDDSKLEYFNYNLTPHVKVLDAVRASSNLPFIFPSFSINYKNYFDGGICNICPVDLVDELF